MNGTFDFSRLRRFPDVEAPNLFAYDATDQLLLAQADAALRTLAVEPAAGESSPSAPYDGGTVAIVGDRYGALTLAAAAQHDLTGLRVHQDALSGHHALDRNAEALSLAGRYRSLPLGPSLFDGADLVLWQLPRSLDELAEVADLIARTADAGVRVFAGGRVKHMTLAMNTVLGEYFDDVSASHAWHKSRILTASGVRRPEQPPSFPHREFHAPPGLWLCAHGATFAGTKLDIGTRYLLDFLDQMRPDARTAVDLGCGNGALAAALAAARPELSVIATDQSAAAVASARATAEANGLTGRIRAVQDDALSGFPAAVTDLMVLNPPFHVGATVHAGIALKLFTAAGRVLAPGGELWTVYNTHLDYRAALEERVGPTQVKGRNKKFTVTVSVRA